MLIFYLFIFLQHEKAHILISFLSSRQLWFNDYLVWKPEEFDGIDHLIVPLDFIWIPDFYIWEFVGENFSPLMSYAYIHHTGKVICDQPIRAETSCYLDIFFFPFDTQKCSFTFGPYLHTVADITLGVHMSDEQLLSDSLQNLQDRGEWELRQINASIQQFFYQKDEWPMCVFTVKIRRKPTLYLVSLILPSAFLMLIDILSFYLPPHSLDRCAFKVTLLLGYTVFLLMMNNILPNNSGGTPLIGGYFLFCLALLVISLLESIFISYILNGLGAQNRTVPQWVKSFVLGYMSQLICYKITDTREHHKKMNVFTVGMFKSYEDELTGNREASGQELERFLKDTCDMVKDIRNSFEHFHIRSKDAEEWKEVSIVLDIFIFRVYIIFITVCMVCLGIFWSQWLTE
ncbi:5-hydroxytryptamine receptor 3A-like [Polypterus senegalus]|uniref:5-hydroxytryptamine receptor 3A-like n=1 Tax=Polypterus senegalus TaxID=55291 RepID=UPI001962FCC2|nr:5-hydroxytryptamine receptor 3A-like [Polypterus senegalus]